jgi:hypothetical protein
VQDLPSDLRLVEALDAVDRFEDGVGFDGDFSPEVLQFCAHAFLLLSAVKKFPGRCAGPGKAMPFREEVGMAVRNGRRLAC